MFAPAERDTLLEVPLRLKFVATGTVGPTRVMLLAPEFNVILAPATKDTLEELPFRLKLTAVEGGLPINWMLPAPVLIVILLPERTIVPVDVAKVLPWTAFAFATFSNGG